MTYKTNWVQLDKLITNIDDVITEPKSERTKRGFLQAKALTERYPVGTVVTLDLSELLQGAFDDRYKQIKVLSEFIFMTNKSFIGFLCSESKDNEDFYNAYDLVEFYTLEGKENEDR